MSFGSPNRFPLTPGRVRQPMRQMAIGQVPVSTREALLAQVLDLRSAAKEHLTIAPPSIYAAQQELIKLISLLENANFDSSGGGAGAGHLSANEDVRSLALAAVFKLASDLIGLQGIKPTAQFCLYGMAYGVLAELVKTPDDVRIPAAHIQIEAAIGMAGLQEFHALQADSKNGLELSEDEKPLFLSMQEVQKLYADEQFAEKLVDTIMPPHNNIQMLHASVFREGRDRIVQLPTVEQALDQIPANFKQLYSFLGSNAALQLLTSLTQVCRKFADLSVLAPVFGHLQQAPSENSNSSFTQLDVKLYIWTCASWAKWRTDPAERIPRVLASLPLLAIRQADHWKTLVHMLQGHSPNVMQSIQLDRILESIRLSTTLFACPEIRVEYEVYKHLAAAVRDGKSEYEPIKAAYRQQVEQLIKFGSCRASVDVARSQLFPAILRLYANENDVHNISQDLKREKMAALEKTLSPIDKSQQQQPIKTEFKEEPLSPLTSSNLGDYDVHRSGGYIQTSTPVRPSAVAKVDAATSPPPLEFLHGNESPLIIANRKELPTFSVEDSHFRIGSETGSTSFNFTMGDHIDQGLSYRYYGSAAAGGRDRKVENTETKPGKVVNKETPTSCKLPVDEFNRLIDAEGDETMKEGELEEHDEDKEMSFEKAYEMELAALRLQRLTHTSEQLSTPLLSILSEEQASMSVLEFANLEQQLAMGESLSTATKHIDAVMQARKATSNVQRERTIAPARIDEDDVAEILDIPDIPSTPLLARSSPTLIKEDDPDKMINEMESLVAATVFNDLPPTTTVLGKKTPLSSPATRALTQLSQFSCFRETNPLLGFSSIQPDESDDSERCFPPAMDGYSSPSVRNANQRAPPPQQPNFAALLFKKSNFPPPPNGGNPPNN